MAFMAEDGVRRTLAAIVAADMVGYSRLMSDDEAGTLARLKAFRRELFEPKTKHYRERIFKTTGDGALVEFKSVIDAANLVRAGGLGITQSRAHTYARSIFLE
jgi:adenylate cyclase